MKRVLIIFALILAGAPAFYGQKPPNAVLVEEFGKITWEDYVARIDRLLNNLGESPSDVAYIVISDGPPRISRYGFRYEQWAKGQLKARRFDSTRVNLIRASNSGETKIQFWTVPPGAEKPQFTASEWSLKLPGGTRPFVWTTTERNSGLITPPEHLSLGLFAEVLKDNPNARANFVISAISQLQFVRERRQILDILVKRYGTDAKRLKFFYVKQGLTRSYSPSTEVWFVP